MLASRLRLILIEVALKKVFFPSLNSFDEDQENSVREKDIMGTYQNRNSMKTVFKRSWWTRQKLCIILGNRRACHPQSFWRPSLLYLSALDYLQDLFKSSSSVLIPSFYSDRHMYRAQIFLHENLIEESYFISRDKESRHGKQFTRNSILFPLHNSLPRIGQFLQVTPSTSW